MGEDHHEANIWLRIKTKKVTTHYTRTIAELIFIVVVRSASWSWSNLIFCYMPAVSSWNLQHLPRGRNREHRRSSAPSWINNNSSSSSHRKHEFGSIVCSFHRCSFHRLHCEIMWQIPVTSTISTRSFDFFLKNKEFKLGKTKLGILGRKK